MQILEAIVLYTKVQGDLQNEINSILHIINSNLKAQYLKATSRVWEEVHTKATLSLNVAYLRDMEWTYTHAGQGCVL